MSNHNQISKEAHLYFLLSPENQFRKHEVTYMPVYTHTHTFTVCLQLLENDEVTGVNRHTQSLSLKKPLLYLIHSSNRSKRFQELDFKIKA